MVISQGFLLCFWATTFVPIVSARATGFYQPGEKVKSSAYDNCPRIEPGITNVHLVPHSHDDVGWLKTVDEYYYGAKPEIQRAGVQYILDSVVKELATDPSKRFIQVETAFFWRWWNEQGQLIRDMVRNLVNEGRLEFTGAGWSMNDEAVCHYSSIIDNMAFGFKTIQEVFGDVAIPRVAWQIDPFGHSREQANLFANMGFDGLFFARIHYEDKLERKTNKTLQMVWEGSDSLGEPSSIFTGVFPEHYSHPRGFCWDILCTDEPINDDPNLEDGNVERIVQDFISTVKETLSYFDNPTNIMYTMGDDFNYQNARQNFKNMDKLIRYVNEKTSSTGIRVFYSTPSCYIKALNDLGLTWTTKVDDFFPYADREHAYWTGYYTSRPTLKYMERRANTILQSAKQISALFGSSDLTSLDVMRRAMGVMQHHDAVTGTEKQNVAYDYAIRLSEAEKAILPIFKFSSLDGETCPYLNISQCETSENNQKFIVTVYNPLPRPTNRFVRFPVTKTMAKVYDFEGDELLVEFIQIPGSVRSVPGRTSAAEYEILFQAEDLPPLGYKSYYVDMMEGVSKNIYNFVPTEFDDPGPFDAQISYYPSYGRGDQNSGAYIFRPASGKVLPGETTQYFKLVGSSLVSEFETRVEGWTSYIRRQYIGEDHHEVEWLVGPIPLDKKDSKSKIPEGKEVVIEYSADGVDNGRVFWTDSNGRQMLKRIRNESEGNPEPVASNYYPITTGLFIQGQNESMELSVLTDRAQGGSSLESGRIELMLHRRIVNDDGRGVGEALNEQAFNEGLVARGRHLIRVDNPTSGGAKWRRLKMQEMYLQPVLIFTPTELGLDEWVTKETNFFKGVNESNIGANVNLLTLEPWTDDKTVLLRLEHLFEPHEEGILSQPATVDLSRLFTQLSVTNITETTLGGNVPLRGAERLHWNTAEWAKNHGPKHAMQKELGECESCDVREAVVVLQPMEIRTFLVQVERPW